MIISSSPRLWSLSVLRLLAQSLTLCTPVLLWSVSADLIQFYINNVFKKCWINHHWSVSQALLMLSSPTTWTTFVFSTKLNLSDHFNLSQRSGFNVFKREVLIALSQSQLSLSYPFVCKRGLNQKYFVHKVLLFSQGYLFNDIFWWWSVSRHITLT